MSDYEREDAIARQCFVETLRNHSDPVRRRAADIIEALERDNAAVKALYANVVEQLEARERAAPSLLIDVTTGRTKLLCSVCDKPVGAQFLLTLPSGSARHYGCDVHPKGVSK